MRDIAVAADVAYQTLYNYFPSKAQLGLALLARDAEDWGSRELGAGEDPVQALGSLARSGIAFVSRRDRELWREAVVEVIRAGESVARQVDPGSGERLDALLAGAQQRGSLDAYLDTQVMANVIESLFESAYLGFIVNGDSDAESVIEGLVRQVELVLGPYLRRA